MAAQISKGLVDCMAKWIIRKYFGPKKEAQVEKRPNETNQKKEIEVVDIEESKDNDDIQIIDQIDSKKLIKSEKRVHFEEKREVNVVSPAQFASEEFEDIQSDEAIDEDEIKEIFDKSNIFTERRPTANKHFISDDPEENEDINDQRWNQLKSLQNDRERKNYVTQKFGNLESGDPTRNMTYHGFLRDNLRRLNGMPIFMPNRNMKTEAIRINKGKIELISRGSSFGSNADKKRKAFGEHEEAPDPKRQMIDVDFFSYRLEQIAIKYKKKTLRTKEDLKYYMRHFRLGVWETTDFLRYYQEDRNNNMVSMDELEKTEAIEKVYEKFVDVYGITCKELCKDCSHQERKRIFHSF